MAKHPDTVVILDQASGYLQIDMLEAYANRYKNRAIVAGSIVERGTPLPSGVKWHKINTYNRDTSVKRIWSWLLGSINMFWVVLRWYRKAHIVAITNPPLSVFVPWMLKCSYDIVIYDIYPDALAHYGYANRKSLVYKVWAKLNRRAFQKAQRIFTLTKGMKELADKYTKDKEKVEVVPLWSGASDFQFVARKDNHILKETGSVDKFNIVYSGNLGLTHPIEKLIELAEYLDPDRFSIIIIGGGAKKQQLEKLSKQKQLPNVHLLPWQPIERLTHNLYAADINVVTLDKAASDLSIPSKTFNILTIGNPILGICSEDSALAELLREHNCGVLSNGADMGNIASEIIKHQENPALMEEMRRNSAKAALNFSRDNALKYL